MNREETIKEYDKRYKENPQKWTIPERNQFALDNLKEYAPEATRIIDVGCGNGHFVEVLEREYPEAEITGMELSSVAIEQAKQKTSRTKYTDSFLADYKSRTKFDLVINMGTVEHIEDVDGALQDLKRIKKVDGIIYFEAPDNLSYSPGEHSYRRLKIGSKQVEWHLTKEEWEELFTKNDLEIITYIEGKKPYWKNNWFLR